MRSLATILCILGAAGLASSGCIIESSDGDGGSPSDDGSVTPQAECRVQSTTPDFGASRVEVGKPIRVEWTSAIDFSSTAGRVHLFSLEGDEISADLEQDGDRAVLVRPNASLQFWREYALTVDDGVTTSDAKACEAESLALVTREPTEAAHPLQPATPFASAVVGTHLVVATRSSRAMQTYDISNPSAPTLVSELVLPQAPVGVVLGHGNRLYVPTQGRGALIFDASDPVNLRQIGNVGTPGADIDIAPFERDGRLLVAIADGVEGVRILDVTNPEFETTVSKLRLDTPVVSVAIEGNLLAVNQAAGFMLLDISNLQAPTVVGTNAYEPALGQLVGDIYDVAFVDGFLAVSTHYSAIITYDLSDPANPTYIDHVFPPAGACGSGCWDRYGRLDAHPHAVYAAANDTGAFRFDVAIDGTLSIGATFEAPGRFLNGTVAGDVMYLGSEGGLVVFTGADTAQPTRTFTETNSVGVITAAILDAEDLLVTGSGFGVRRFNLTDPANPTIVSSSATLGVERDSGPQESIRAGEYLVVADGRAGLTFLQPNGLGWSYVSNYNGGDQSKSVVVSGDHTFDCQDNGGLYVTNIADMSTPSLLASVSFAAMGACNDLILRGDRVFATAGRGFVVVDVSDPSAPSVESTLMLSSEDLGMFITELDPDHVAITTYTSDFEGIGGSRGRLMIIDVSNPASPIVVYESEDLGGAREVIAVGDKLFVAGGWAGVHVFSLADVEAPVLEGSIATRGFAQRLVRKGDFIYVAERDGGLGVIATGQVATP